VISLNDFVQEPIVEFESNVDTKDCVVVVCVFTYNHANFIEECLQSILDQETNFRFAIYVGEDESSDGTREICLRYASKYPELIKLVLHSRKNNIWIGGRPSGRFNSIYAYSNIKSQYIAICEGDDKWTDPMKLQKQVDFLRSNEEFGICYTDCEMLIDGGERVAFHNSEKVEFGFFDSIQNKHGATLTMMFERNLVDARLLLNSSRDSVMGDWPIECIVTNKKKGRILPFVSAVYNRTEDGATLSRMSNPLVFYNSRISFMEYLTKSGEVSGDRLEFTRSILNRCYLMRSSLHFREGNLLLGFRDLRSLRLRIGGGLKSSLVKKFTARHVMKFCFSNLYVGLKKMLVRSKNAIY